MQEDLISTKPYLLRALYEWCTDNGFTPYIVVRVDHRTRVPRQFVRNGEITLNISFGATSQLKIDNDWIEFLARFSGKSHRIEVPVENVAAIYARENNEGMAFPVEISGDDDKNAPSSEIEETGERDEPPRDATASAEKKEAAPDNKGSKGGRAHLKLVK